MNRKDKRKAATTVAFWSGLGVGCLLDTKPLGRGYWLSLVTSTACFSVAGVAGYKLKANK